MNSNFDYNLQPGKCLKKRNYDYDKKVISVIMPSFNDNDLIFQTVNSVLNQTFPAFELLIIDDGTSDKDSLKKLDEIEKMDDRIKVFHKKNEGLAATRDYGASKASIETKYLAFIDSDDLFDETFFECAYLSLESNNEAAWAYSDSVGFDCQEYLWNKWFDSDKLKKVNDLLSATIIRKDAFNAVGGYGLREKAVNEDWNFWLKLIAKGYYPIHMSFYGIWYRRKEVGELARSRDNKKRALEIINNTAKTIKKRVEAIQYPRFSKNDVVEEFDDVVKPINKSKNKINILMIVPWMVTGGADLFNLNLIKRLDKNIFNVILVTTIPNKNILRQSFEENVIVYDMTSFIDRKYWLAFINYIIKKECINMIFNTNSACGYAFVPYLKSKHSDIPIVDYVHMEEWYYNNGGFARFSSECSLYIDKTFVCNKSTENVLKSYFKRNDDEVDTVYIGVDEERFNPSLYAKDELLKKYNLDGNNKYIISYICRISAQKRPKLMQQIIKSTVEKKNDILFLIVGDGDMLDDFKNFVKDNSLTENVVFLGNVKETEEIYAISDVTINCSIKEGLALTSYESLAMGIPVISADVGGQKELIDDNVGVIVPCLQKEEDINNYDYSKNEIDSYVSAIEKVLSNIEHYKSNCRKRILKSFTIDKMVEQLSKEFKNIVSKPNSKKIENGKELDCNLALQLVEQYFTDSDEEYKYFVQCYQKDIYGRYLVDKKGVNLFNSKTELMKERLWQFTWWRRLTSSKIWKKIKNLRRPR